jgi:predicted nucleic acid-binding protein
LRAVVVDASAVAEYLLRTTRAERFAGTIEAGDILLHVPALCDVELVAVLRRALLGKRMTEARAWEAMSDYMDLPLTRHGHVKLIERVLQLRENFSVYDATYVALAERLGAELLTADEPLAKAARTHTTVSVLPVLEIQRDREEST